MSKWLMRRWGYTIRVWRYQGWTKPAYYSNFYREVDFGKFSLFLGKGPNYTDEVFPR